MTKPTGNTPKQPLDPLDIATIIIIIIVVILTCGCRLRITNDAKEIRVSPKAFFYAIEVFSEK